MEQLLGPTSLRQGHEMPVRSIKNLSGGGPRPRRCERATARTRGPAPIHCCGKETACSAPGGHRGWWWAVATGARGFGAAPRTHGAAPGAMPAAANPAPRRNGPPRAFSLIKWHIPGDNFPDSGPWAHAHSHPAGAFLLALLRVLEDSEAIPTLSRGPQSCGAILYRAPRAHEVRSYVALRLGDAMLWPSARGFYFGCVLAANAC